MKGSRVCVHPNPPWHIYVNNNKVIENDQGREQSDLASQEQCDGLDMKQRLRILTQQSTKTKILVHMLYCK